MQVRSSLWKKTGIIALRDAQLSALPPEVWEVAANAYTADLTNNQLASLPPNFCGMTCLQKLHLGSNRLTHEGLPPALMPAFQGLQTLGLSHNRCCYLELKYAMPELNLIPPPPSLSCVVSRTEST